MTWNRLEKARLTTRQWVETLDERPQEITPGRWRAMQRQLEQDREQKKMNDSSSQNDLIFWVYESVR
jgi:hypothetical protein